MLVRSKSLDTRVPYLKHQRFCTLNLHQCQIVNNTGITIILKIIGFGRNHTYTPDIPGVTTGLMFAHHPYNQDLHDLAEGERMVIIWSSDGSKLLAFSKVRISSPTTVEIKMTGTTTKMVSVDAVDGSGISVTF